MLFGICYEKLYNKKKAQWKWVQLNYSASD